MSQRRASVWPMPCLPYWPRLICKLAVCALAGALWSLAFAPYHHGWLALFALSICWWVVLHASVTLAVTASILFSLSAYGFGVQWITNSLQLFGGLSAAMSLAVLCLLAWLLAMFAALWAWGVARLTPQGSSLRLMAMCFGWPWVELARAYVLGGFTWLQLGYALIDTPLARLAPWLSVYGVSLAAVILCAVMIAFVQGKWRGALMMLLVIFGLSWLAGLHHWTEDDGRRLRVGLVHAPVSVTQKWDEAFFPTIMQRYLHLSQELAQRGAELVVWPEASIVAYEDDPIVAATLEQPLGAALLFGILRRESSEKALRRYNAALLQNGGHRRSYHKVHRVPFGEYWPLPWPKSWTRYDFNAGSDQQGSLALRDVDIGVTICFEASFLRDMRRVHPNAGFFINLSEDGWFGEGAFADQQVQMMRMRALESGRWVLRAANPTEPAIIDAHGRLRTEEARHDAATFWIDVPLRSGTTPVMRWGLVPFLIVTLLGLTGVLGLARFNSRSRP